MYRRNAQGWSKHLDFIVLELISLQVAYILASLLRHHELPYTEMIYRNLAIALTLIDAVVIMFLNTMHDVLKRNNFAELSRTIRHCVTVLALAATYMFMLQMGYDYSRILLFITCLFHIIIGYSTRVAWKAFIRKHGMPISKRGTMLVVLSSDSAEQMMTRLMNNHIEGYELVGAVLDEGGSDEVCGIPVVATLSGAADYISQKWIDSVYIDCPSTDPRIMKLMDDCHTMAVPVHYHVPAMSRDGVKQFVEKVGGTTVLTTSINYATPLQLLLKRMLDILGGVVGSILAILIIAV